MFETAEQRLLGQHARDFACSEIAPHVARMEANPGQVEEQLVREMARLGWMTVAVPSAYGGMGLGHVAKTALLTEISRVSPAMGAALQASQLGAAMLLHYGSTELLDTWMPAIFEGACLPTIAVTEAESGGHVLGMQATARRSRGGWVINGRKMYVGNSHVGDVHGVVVRTGPDSAGSRKLSAFLVEATRPGVRLVPHEEAVGLHGFAFGDLVFEDVWVPAANMIGEEGDGKDVAYAASILAGRLNLSGVALGIIQATVDDTVAYAQGCPRYRATLAEQPVITRRLGQMQAHLMTAQCAVDQAARNLDAGRPCDDKLFHAKYVSVAAALRTTDHAMDVHAAAALRRARRVWQLAADARCVAPPAGTGDIQLYRLGQDATGADHGHYSQRLASRVALHTPTGTGQEHAA